MHKTGLSGWEAMAMAEKDPSLQVQDPGSEGFGCFLDMVAKDWTTEYLTRTGWEVRTRQSDLDKFMDEINTLYIGSPNDIRKLASKYIKGEA